MKNCFNCVMYSADSRLFCAVHPVFAASLRNRTLGCVDWKLDKDRARAVSACCGEGARAT